MASLFSLPNELLEQVTLAVGPPDIENWTLACRRLFKVGSSALEIYRQKKRRYGSITEELQHPTLLLPDLLTSEDFRWYTGALHMDDHFDNHGKMIHDIDTLVQSHHHELELWVKSLPPSLRHDEPFYRTISKLLSGEEGPMIYLLLCGLPNLRDLSIQPKRNLASLKLVERLWLSTSIDPGSMILTNLRKVHLVENFAFWNSFDYLFPFAGLPSMRILSCNKLISSNSLEHVLPNESYLTEIDLQQGAVDTWQLTEFLRCVKALEKFHFKCCDEYIGIPEWDPRGVISALRQHAKNTLVDLSLEGRRVSSKGQTELLGPLPQESILVGSLQSFSSLKKARLDGDMLFAPDASEEVENLLPESLVTLIITDRTGDKVIRAFFKHWCDKLLQAPILPCLNEVIIEKGVTGIYHSILRSGGGWRPKYPIRTKLAKPLMIIFGLPAQ